MSVELDNAKQVFFDTEGNFEFKDFEQSYGVRQVVWTPTTRDVGFDTLRRLKLMFGADEAYIEHDDGELLVTFIEDLEDDDSSNSGDQTE